MVELHNAVVEVHHYIGLTADGDKWALTKKITNTDWGYLKA